MKKIILAAAASILLLLMVLDLTAADNTVSTDSGDKISWMSYDAGIKKAKEENKHVFINFTTSWCGYCKKMKKEAFSDDSVANLLNNEFVAVKVDGDSQNELDVDGYKITESDLTKKEYHVSGYPTFWFLKPDGTKLGVEKGYRPTDWMISALTYVKDYKYDTTRTNADNKQSGK